MQVFGDDGTRIDVCVDGDGAADPVVLIHGFPFTRELWNEQTESLSRVHRVFRPDLRGIGSSSVPSGPYLMETLAADIATVLDAHGVERAAIVGHSLGGYVALAFARMFSERVTRLALVCSRLAADTAEKAAERQKLADRIEREGTIESFLGDSFLKLFAPQTLKEKPDAVERARDLVRRIDPHGAASMLRGMAMRSSADDIAPDLEVPMLMIAGAHDATVSLEEARVVTQAFPQGSLVICDRSGHLPMLEESETVTTALVKFLKL